mmetsp:Transcript_3654/g.9859  ORF Transcript_3654/g.9859 Transcript_3654/m.9859 type:complete len:209 (+) Transcript_3654:939-1565(+)
MLEVLDAVGATMFRGAICSSATWRWRCTSNSCSMALEVGSTNRPVRGCRQVAAAAAGADRLGGRGRTPKMLHSTFMVAVLTTRMVLSAWRISSTAGSTGLCSRPTRGPPSLGRKLGRLVSSCHITSTPSLPPDSRYVVSGLKARHPTGAGCQCSVVRGGGTSALFFPVATPSLRSAGTAAAKSRQISTRPVTSPAASTLSLELSATHV